MSSTDIFHLVEVGVGRRHAYSAFKVPYMRRKR